jgi:hypothetical protein
VHAITLKSVQPKILFIGISLTFTVIDFICSETLIYKKKIRWFDSSSGLLILFRIINEIIIPKQWS